MKYNQILQTKVHSQLPKRKDFLQDKILKKEKLLLQIIVNKISANKLNF